ncbi:protoporphyrinogen oxidase [uncultured Bacteroides sp.]|uniref:protoporphyrinogen oxidase n=1 Tax=uncultured Bacteroides sp. TaxID=162156 RepID=UPI002AAAE437|nr:protoporphyrinogen oxidase [uncultured Bacteroides sp.]
MEKIEKEVDVVVIGAGITGLVTTFTLMQKGLKVLLLEKKDQVGGQLHTIYDEGFVFESGPNTGVVSNMEVVQLFKALEDECTLEIARKESKVRLIWKKGAFHPLPAGHKAAIATPLFTWSDKIRILFEPFRCKGRDPLESIASLTRRRLGKSYLDYAVDPFISGIYAGDPEKLITRFAMPKLYRLDAEYGSFVRGAIKRRPILLAEKQQGISKEVFSVKGGFASLVVALSAKVTSDNMRLSLGEQLQITPAGKEWLINLGTTNELIHAKHVISTVPAYAMPSLFPFLAAEQLAPIVSLRYAPVIQVGVGMKDGKNVPQAFGGLIPGVEKERVLGILFNSSCYAGRAPENGASLSFFVGGMKHPELLDLRDDELKDLVVDSLHRMLGYPVGTEPDKLHVFRHKWAIPQYEADSESRLEAISHLQRTYPGLILGGSIRDGIGLADRIKQAFCMAQEVADSSVSPMM